MRRFTFVLSLVAGLALLAPRTSSAQVAIDLGVKGGLAISDLDVEDDEGIDSRTGLVGGGFATFGIGNNFFIQPELLYSMKGAKGDVEGVDATFKLDYFEIPVLFGARFPIANSPIEPRVFAGPAVAFEMSCKIDGEEGGVSVSVDCEDLGLDTKSVDFGVAFGAGFGYALEKLSIIVDGRYDLGIANIDDSGFDTGDVKNRAWQFMAGVAFPLN
ncbi:MAG: porin family protein [Gemmatimonadota bacterium]